MDEIIRDERFSHILKDARFRRVPKDQRKVKIDRRFKAMFSDKKFKLKYSVDKRGRPVNQTTNENLKRFYELSESEESDDDDGDVMDTSEKEDGEREKEEAGRVEKQNKKMKGYMGKEDKLGKEKKKEKSSKGQIKQKKSSSEDEEDSDEEVDKKRSKGKLNLSSSSGKLEKKEQKLKMLKKKFLGKEKSKENVRVTKTKQKTENNTSESGESSDSDAEIEDVVDDEEEYSKKSTKGNQVKAKAESDEDEGSSSDSEQRKDGDSAPDLARGDGNVETSSEEDSEEELDDRDGVEGEEDLEHDWGEMDKNVPQVDELGHRLAICNMDWDRIKAQDIYVLLNSFKPANGVLKSVKVYPSEFGLRRMKEEQEQGPQGLAKASVTEEEQDAEDAGGSSYHTEKLRQYQLNRLKYYYAVAECDSIATANHIYGECDGMEYESSSARLDLRFVPDEMEFEETPASVCTDMPDATSYKPSLFFTTALCQSKVDLTWDETDRDRQQRITQQFQEKEIQEDNLMSYLASSSDEEGAGDDDDGRAEPDSGLAESDEEDEDAQIQKYKSLLLGLDEGDKKKKEKNLQMEITWEPGLRGATEGMVRKKKESKDKTVWGEYLQKKKEKKKKKKKDKNQDVKISEEKSDTEAQLKLDEAAFSDDDLPDGVDLNDPFFAEELAKGDDNKPSKKKGKKKKKRSVDTVVNEDSKQTEAELSLLLMGEEDSRKHFNLDNLVTDDKNKKKNKKAKEASKAVDDNFKLNVADPRFEALFDSHLYNIDPSAPEFKKTRAMDELIEEKIKRRKDEKPDKKKMKMESEKNSDQISDVRTSSELKRKVVEVGDSEQKSKKLHGVGVSYGEQSLESLVKSVKSKTQQFHHKKKR